MLIVTTNELPGYAITLVLGELAARRVPPEPPRIVS